MRRTLAVVLVLAGCGAPEQAATPDIEPEATIAWGLVVHGGAGTIARDQMTPEREAEHREAMAAALTAGHAVLAEGGSSLDAVVATINVLEDSPLFNAGKGAVYTADGTHSLDASIMEGATRRAGAVAGVTTVRNPINLARLVMEQSEHVFLAGEGAEAFGRLQGVAMVEPDYFHTEFRRRQLQEAQAADPGQEGEARTAEDPDGASGSTAGWPRGLRLSRFGTVGVVALDQAGDLAAGTSTGGTTNKRWGRIGDSPVIGAGTYADSECGASGTGWGEYFIRNVVAYDICARVRYQGLTLAQSAHAMIMEQLESQEPETGGIIALDGDGHVVMTFNTTGMYRGYVGPDGRPVTAIYR
jgi:beta-aspartyl-peptidase (threonine type)